MVQVGAPHTLAIDVGCGTGNSSRPLVEWFDHVTGCDISEAQIQQAQQVETNPNVSYRSVDFKNNATF